MTEDTKPEIDWTAIERHYRAGELSLNEIAKRYGVSRPGITKRAEREGWVRDLSKKIEQATQNKVVAAVAKQQVAGELPVATKMAEKAYVDAYSDASAAVDMQQRTDVKRALDVQRALLDELEAMTDQRFRPFLEAMAEALDESGPTAQGGWKADKVNELYRYIISLGGRIKMAKELGAAHGVYLPLQRKMFKLDEGKSNAPFEDLLAKLGAAQQEK